MEKRSGFQFVLIFAILFVLLANLSFGAQRKVKTPPPKKPQTTIQAITDENVEANLKLAEEYLKKNLDAEALEISSRVYEYAKGVIELIEAVEKKEREMMDKAISQNIQESLLWKFKRREILKNRYMEYIAKAAFFCGYIHAKRNETETAVKYLLEAVRNARFSESFDSIYVKSKNLLATLYSLEGEL
ncbi:MAG: hypothetical protein NZ583_02920 [Desulfobacterota bacterium]|nr:hypothetical protein [Thermodesulfobacteriota bacterium]MDW8001840.1 hypothetical protein [Deltaproteobacteria bacterium]